MTVRPTQDKIDKLARVSDELLSNESNSIREVAGLVGMMIAYSPAAQYGGAHIKDLEMDKIDALKQSRGNFDASMIISDLGRHNILWWKEHFPLASREVAMVPPDITLYTDASEQGWGAFCVQSSGFTSLAGTRWTFVEAQDHINVLELQAVYFGLQSLTPFSDTHIAVLSDNTTAVAYLRNMGGVRSRRCNDVAKDIWQWCEERNIWLTPSFIPGILNVNADYASRNFTDDVNWELNPKLFAKICDKWSTPEVDMFASRINTKLEKFVSWMPEPEAWKVDAFSFSWTFTNNLLYFFPPFSLSGRVIREVLSQKCCAVVVLPDWPTQPWSTMALNSATSFLKFRKGNKNLLPHGEPNNPLQFGSTPLVACLFSTTY